MFEKKPVWYIEASTGCSCCAYENFNWGFYFNREDAIAQANDWSNGRGNPLASQYSKYGRYRVRETVAEFLPDGRAIVGGETVFAPEDMKTIGKFYW